MNHHNYGDGITAIDALYQRPGLAAFYSMVVGGQAAFIDTGTSLSLPQALAALERNRLTPADVAYVIPTHVHLDHAGGAGAMMRAFPNARLVVHPRGAKHLIDPEKLIAGVIEVYGADAAARQFGEIIPVPAGRTIEAPDEFMLDFNGRPLRFLDTPGHARHHFCVWDECSRGVFTGDTFGISYREFDTDRGAFIFPTTTPVQFDPGPLHASIDRLLALKPRQLFLTHFGRVADDAKDRGGTTAWMQQVERRREQPPRATQGAVAEIERLARDMHALIDALVTIAQAARDAGAERQRRMIDAQRALLTTRLSAHGCKIDPNQVEQLLGMDYVLNAQGLGVWLDRDQK